MPDAGRIAAKFATSRAARVKVVGLLLVLVLAAGAAASGRIFPYIGCSGYGYSSGQDSCEQPRPDASFTVFPEAPRVGGEVRLSADTYGLEQYAWDLDGDGAHDDGDGREVEIPAGFQTAGDHTVGLRVTDAHGRAATASRRIEVHAVNQRPSAVFSIQPGSPRTGRSVDFTATADDRDGEVVAADWDLDGDGTFETAADVENSWWGAQSILASRTFATAGTKTVALRITDDGGATAQTVRTFEVHAENVAPELSFFPPFQARVGRSVSFHAFASDPDGADDGPFGGPAPLDIGFDLDPAASAPGDPSDPYEIDNGASTSRNHTFTAPGRIEIGARAVDADGGATEERTMLTVSDENTPPHAFLNVKFGSPQELAMGEQTILQAYGSDPDGLPGAAVTYEWDLDGDSVVDYEPASTVTERVTPAFSSPGDKPMRVRVTDAEGARTVATRTLLVHMPNLAPDVGAITLDTPVPVAGSPVAFSMTRALDPEGDDLTYAWDLDDDGAADVTDDSGQASRTFAAAGVKTVRVLVEDGNGGQTEQALTFEVAPTGGTDSLAAPVMDWSPVVPRAGAEVVFWASAFDDEGDGYEFDWDFDGDGTADETGGFVSLPAGLSGSEQVTVTAHELDGTGARTGRASFARQTVWVQTANRLPAMWVSPPWGVVAGEPVWLHASPYDSDGQVVAVDWDLNGDGDYTDPVDRLEAADGDPDNLQTSVEHAFPEPGEAVVNVRATDDEGASVVRTLQVEVDPASVNRAPAPTLTLTVDGGSPATVNRARVGQTLRAEAYGGDPDGDETTLRYDLDADPATGPDGFETPEPAPGEPGPALSFAEPGSYRLRVQATDPDGLSGIGLRMLHVAAGNLAPEIDGVSGPSRVRTGRPVSFSVSFDDPDGQVIRAEWDLDGDGQFDDHTDEPDFGWLTWSEVEHTYAAGDAGQKRIGVRVTDDAGPDAKTAVARLDLEVSTVNLPPYGDFGWSPQRPLKGEELELWAWGEDTDSRSGGYYSPGDPVTFAWDFDGDGTYTDEIGSDTVLVTFPTAGPREVGLRITDEEGAEHVVRRTVPVRGQAPDASFTVSPDAVQAAGTTLTFDATATDADGTVSAYEWDFGEDGDNRFDDASGASVTHAYAQPGFYQVNLRVRDSDGDITTVTRHVEVDGQCNPCLEIEFGEHVLKGRQFEADVTAYFGPGLGRPLTYEWDVDGDGFDDGGGTSRTITYPVATTETLRVRARSGGAVVAHAARTIEVIGDRHEPEVWIGGWPSAPRVGQDLELYASAYDPDGGPIVDYEWREDADLDGSYERLIASGPDAYELLVPISEPREYRFQLTVRDVFDQVGRATRSFHAHEGNLEPHVSVYAERSPAGVNAPVRFFAFAHDPDGSITRYEWDTDGDGDFSDEEPSSSGPNLDDIVVRFPSAGLHTVGVRVTDNEPAPDTATATATTTIQVTDANAPPQPTAAITPNPADKGVPARFTAHANDPDGDEAVEWLWDVDDNGSYDDPVDRSGRTITLTFPETGVETIGLRVRDARGAWGEADVHVQVVDSPPEAIIDGPAAGEVGDTLRFTDASQAENPRTVDWDLDNDGVYDAAGPHVDVDLTGVAPGVRKLRMRVTDADAKRDVAVHTYVVRAPQPVGIPDPEPPIDPSTGEPAQIGVIVDPESGLSTIQVGNGTVSNFPGGCMPLDVKFKIKKSATATVQDVSVVLTSGATVLDTFDGADITGPDPDTGEYTLHIDCVQTGDLTVRYTILEPGQDPQEFEVPIGGIQLIDPQGVVYDRAAYDSELDAIGETHETATEAERTAARAATAIQGATVTLQRFVSGSWQTLSASDPGIEPNVNPQITGGNGLYQWDVSPGTYRVKVSAPGFASVDSMSVDIPPPVLDLHIPMEKNYSPQASLTQSAMSVPRRTGVTFTSTSVDPGGGALKSQQWDLDGDGQFDDATGPSAAAEFATLGEKTVRLRVTDADDEIDVATATVQVVNRDPQAGIEAPATATRGVEVDLGADAGDPDGDALTYAWDLDGDGEFDDATGAAAAVTYAKGSPLGDREVGLRASDAFGGVDEATVTIEVVNVAPVAAAIATDPAVPMTGEEFTLTATGASDPDSDAALVYAWDLDDDGQFDDATGASTDVTRTAGTHEFSVRAIDGDGAHTDTTRPVKVNTAPVSAITGPDTGHRGEELTLTSAASDADGDALTLAWDLDNDGQFDDSTAAEPDVTFTTLGDKTVRLRATDTSGVAHVASHVVSVVNRPPVAGTVTVAPAAPKEGEPITLGVSGESDPDTGGPLAYAWETDGDGQFDDGATESIEITLDEGTHPVQVRVTDADAGTAAAGRDVIVGPPNRAPVAGIGAPAQATRGVAVTLTSTSTDEDGDPLTIQWDLDADGQFDDATGASVQHAFSGALGARGVALRATDTSSASDVAEATVTVVNAAPVAGSITADPATPVAGQEVTLTSAGASDPDTGGAVDRAWDLDGDGQFDDATGATAKRAFATAGTHPVAVRVSDADGASATAALSLVVGPAPEPTPTPTPQPTPTPAPTDTTAPAIGVKSPAGQTLKTVLAKGLRLSATLSEGARVRFVLTIDARTARRLKLAGRKARKPVTVGQATVSLAAGQATAVVKLTARARKRLRKARSLTLKVTAAATDAAGNDSPPVSRTLRLKRR